MPRITRTPLLIVLCTFTLGLLFWSFPDSAVVQRFPHLPGQESKKDGPPKTPKFKSEPKWTPPPVSDPFSYLEHHYPPEIPSWNVPDPNLHEKHGLSIAPTMFVGFGRTWPVLLQCVVSYLVAGWPPSQLVVVENTGVQLANKRGDLSLQNPFYLNYTILQDILGVRVVRTPAILNFAQMQNFFLNQALENEWEYYLFSHSDQLVFSFEEGLEGVTPPAGEEGYKPMYQLVVESIADARKNKPRWGKILYAFNDYLTTFNTAVMDTLGGWDSMIPFYTTDCDMYSRMRMGNWTDIQTKAGHFNDVGSVLNDLRVLYRDPAVIPQIVDLNPLPPEKQKKQDEEILAKAKEKGEEPIVKETPKDVNWKDPKEYYNALKNVGDTMRRIKLSNNGRGRNTWQLAQRGGRGEPYYYDPEGIDWAINSLTDAGRRTYKEKWAAEKCNAEYTGLGLDDAWRVLPQSEW
ncbi:hypothetical protein MKZ38_001529 [Zalerion maritima]|uniref:Uncharacterized protein n=1 Tax=Zalerion maritima TaxID=339359 RepID=A0AAD5RQU4_9PEZI|nr:hypothetical protein MKZ38_001529 [Zalerion maritima]